MSARATDYEAMHIAKGLCARCRNPRHPESKRLCAYHLLRDRNRKREEQHFAGKVGRPLIALDLEGAELPPPRQVKPRGRRVGPKPPNRAERRAIIRRSLGEIRIMEMLAISEHLSKLRSQFPLASSV